MLLGRMLCAVTAWCHCSVHVNASEVPLQHRINVVSTRAEGWWLWICRSEFLLLSGYVNSVQARAGEKPVLKTVFFRYPYCSPSPASANGGAAPCSCQGCGRRIAFRCGFRLKQLPGEGRVNLPILFLFSYTKDFYYLNELPASLP